MINVFAKNNHLVEIVDFHGFESFPLDEQNILWFELINPTETELQCIVQNYHINTSQEEPEKSAIAKYWENSTSITINTYSVYKDTPLAFHAEPMTYFISDNILFTLYNGNLPIFEDVQKRILASPKKFQDGFDILSKILELYFEKGADYLEEVNRETSALRKQIVLEPNICTHEDTLITLSFLQEFNMELRDSLFDKRRIITTLLKSNKVDNETKKDFNIILKDFSSLVDFSTANLNALDNIQNLFTSQVNVEQNKIIKLFTVATMAMMPPTLIGTIYGMNFEVMPELRWEFGYPLAVLTMIISTILPILYFKKKGWL
ncbi:magnesium/cobalt transporter CorA [Helicobacter bizzozeronii]|uniref:Magnesium transport protein CorA n=1 Tax=Helicobacter bizzozeronii (strain CIII-1) TaxID=1002804 RepID=F8KQ93_HELBC|nr:magnesium/cobalt transporter CorA [Helicobacter bizzozeronii]GMB92504.1 Magnesium and cobalt transport protein CorA [Helicobacter bizzozeronii]GMT38141.1 Magnesium and cobalt transport protein CorA [Helicobacter bizzozeronii]CCB80142.1 magnesium and cobalt transport protein CorA [Helicobacter bizzozeronii CIII-1]CCF81615.1 Magnesium and cobalt transport protein CorA [Helicobacter bizzozeronii CCUG 35545]